MNIKKGDKIYVIAGREKGKLGVVEKTILDKNRVVIEGVNIRKHHLKPTQARPKGGIAEYPAAFSASNVMIVCPHCSKTTRVKNDIAENGKKFRICKHCNASLDVQ